MFFGPLQHNTEGSRQARLAGQPDVHEQYPECGSGFDAGGIAANAIGRHSYSCFYQRLHISGSPQQCFERGKAKSIE
jgi:hypothetical protein